MDHLQKELNEKSVFFSAIRKRAVVLYEFKNSAEELPSIQHPNQTFREELAQYNTKFPNYKDQRVEKLYFSEGRNITHIHDFFVVPILSEELQQAFATLLKRYGAKIINVKLRKVILEYAYSVTQDGTPNDFDETLLYFRDLMEMFDVAEHE